MRLASAVPFLLMSSVFGQIAVTFDAIPATETAKFKVTGSNCQPGAYTTPSTLSWSAGPDCTVEMLPADTGALALQLPRLGRPEHREDPRDSVPAGKTTRSLRLQVQTDDAGGRRGSHGEQAVGIPRTHGPHPGRRGGYVFIAERHLLHQQR